MFLSPVFLMLLTFMAFVIVVTSIYLLDCGMARLADRFAARRTNARAPSL